MSTKQLLELLLRLLQLLVVAIVPIQHFMHLPTQLKKLLMRQQEHGLFLLTMELTVDM